ncbi:prepilin-type N-terminal cleavage/methylation domain-containing protein [Bradyrhizobium diazoefficiens]|uniref:type II secretion system protein GspJ n=1 Tax=Bradyrhizobium diazoefficiens TaxID=1355477 RepID=UPI00190DA12D|nr:type II secretion system protein GspJ [Bradyrhizobium diazoefficiens]MBK3665372.1 prepilin-type N-terminal cleavage/methylation domain-containing protein [Bradyrhizobium diazoefficiens]
MIGLVGKDRPRRPMRFRAAEQGLTLVELLVSMAILALLAGCIVGGLSMGRRAFDADQANGNDARADAAIQSLLNLVASALPYPIDDKNSAVFEGSEEKIRFVVLSEGRALRGGAYGVDLRHVGGELVLTIARRPQGPKQSKPPISTVVVLRGVRAVHFEYFGASGQAVWQTEWHSQALPNLVSILVDFEDGRRSGPRAVIALRQG